MMTLVHDRHLFLLARWDGLNSTGRQLQRSLANLQRQLQQSPPLEGWDVHRYWAWYWLNGHILSAACPLPVSVVKLEGSSR